MDTLYKNKERTSERDEELIQLGAVIERERWTRKKYKFGVGERPIGETMKDVRTRGNGSKIGKGRERQSRVNVSM